MTRETVGKIATDLASKTLETRDPIEIERELHKDYEKNVLECIERGKKDFINTDFFVVVITKKEPLMQNVLRHYYFPRLSCPTPDYDQTVYRYVYATDKIEFIWTIPARDTCFMLKNNKLQVAPSEYGLLDFVLKFDDGTLRRLAKKLNGEEEESSALITN